MLDFFTSPLFLLFARLCVGGVFILSGIGKWVDKPGTEASMARYLFLPKGTGRFVSIVFPPLELAIGLALIFGLLTRVAALGAVLLFVVFTGLIIYDLARGKTESCHCFGRLTDDKLTPLAVVRNVLLMALALIVFFAFDGWMALDHMLLTSYTVPFDGTWGWLMAATPPDLGPGTAPDAALVVPVTLLSFVTVLVIVFGGRAVSMVRTTLNGMGFR